MEEVIKLNLFDNIISVKEVKEGYYKRKKYIVKTLEQQYFIKVLPYKATKKEIEKTKWIHETYIQNNIPLVPLLDIVIREDKTILVYPFFEGKNLKEKKLTLEEYNTYGSLVAKEVKKMNSIKCFPKMFNLFNLKQHHNKYIKKLNYILADENYKNKIIKLFTKEEIKNLKLRFKTLLKEIEHHEMILNHNDIKLANIMLDKDQHYYLVDIEPIDLTPIGFNINYSIYTFLFSNSYEKNEKTFLKGFIKTIDPNKNLIKEFEYFIISDFINELQSLIDKKYNILLKESKKIKEILLNKNNVLETILYS